MNGVSVCVVEAFYTIEDNVFVPTRSAHGYWQKGTLSGSAMASLLGHVIEHDHLDESWVPARFGVDMVRMATAAPLTVDTTVLHEGGRIRLVEASLIQDGRLCARAVCQLLRTSQQPANPVWQAPAWPAPHPETLSSLKQFGRWDARPIPAGHARFDRTSPGQSRAEDSNPPVLGQLAPANARQTWLRAAGEVVAGAPLTPFARVFLTADFASPLSHSSEQGIDFVNTDFTVHLHRLPVGEWLGYELATHGSTDGVASGLVWLHDLSGPIGAISVSALAMTRRV
ncbi:thioesterase family protein [Novosphingobium sp.]|uniref:thioesterase family protein n=1 Tax=Novosphingobium sp. TaxID=1874826 RepID=UPI0038BC0E82